MQRLEQEIKELQAHLGTVVQALGFLQAFLESDYGLKYQFHAYCSSPIYSEHSGVLEVLKEKFPLGNVQGRGEEDHDICYTNSLESRSDEMLYGSSSVTGNDSSLQVQVQYSGQGTESELQAITLTCTSPCNGPNDDPDFASTNDQASGDAMIPTVVENMNNSPRLPIIVDEEELFEIGVTDHTRIKLESQELFHQSNPELDAEGNFVDENNSGEEIENIVHTPTNEVTETPSRKAAVIKKKKKVSDGLQCTHCRRRCSDKAQLELHMTHHKQQFQCSECGIWLADKAVLIRHMRTHTGDRPYRCMFCKEAFSRQDIVKKHIVRKHKDLAAKSQITKKPCSNSSKNS